MAIKKKKIGLIVGSGKLASFCLDQLFRLGYETIIVRLPCSNIKIKRNIDYIDLRYEKINEAFSFLKGIEVQNIALIGYMDRPDINVSAINIVSQKILHDVILTLKKGDGEIFSSIKKMLVEQKFTPVKVQDLLPELTLSEGIYGAVSEKEKGLKEIEAGVNFFLKYANLDVGQSLIFQNGHCIGMETITGTDEMLRAIINYRKKLHRASLNILSEGILIKGSKPDQILDIDTPVIGPNTIKLAKKARLKGIVIESNKVILVTKNLIFEMLKNYNMFLIATDFLNKDFKC